MKKLMVTLGLLLLVGQLVFISCSRAPSKLTESVAGGRAVAPSPAPAPPVRTGVLKESAAGALSAATEERMIVRTGDILLVVKDVVDTRDKIAQLAVRLGGYVVSSWISGEEEGMQGNVSFRVPDEKFESALAELRKSAVRVESESTNSQDVTEQYTDLEARLKNAEATEKQYLALLEKAKTVEETLRVYESLSRIRYEIDSIKGQMKYLERTSSMSLINARLKPVATAKPLTPVAWSALEVLKSAIRGLATFGQWLANIAIWLVIFLPIWGTILGIFWWRRRRRKRTR